MNQASINSVLLGVFIYVSVALAGCGPGGGGAGGDVEDLCAGVECSPNEQCDSDTGQCAPAGDGAEGEGEGEGEGECECVGDDCDNLTGGDPILRDFELPTPLFAADSAWNQRADTVEVLPESDELILVLYRVLVGDQTSVFPQLELNRWPFMAIGYDAFTVPVFLTGEGEQEVRLRDYDGVEWYPSPTHGIETLGGPVTVPASAGTVRPAGPLDTGADGWLVLYDVANAVEYDFFAATTVLDTDGMSLGGGQPGPAILEAGAVDFFNVGGAGANADGLSSARAVGTPLLAGLILPEDVASGAIEHALAVAIPYPRNLASDPGGPLDSDYFYPASTPETDFYNMDPMALASGQRLRLKETLADEDGEPIAEEEFAPITRMYLAALRNYGAYIVDNAGSLNFYAEDIHTANLDLSDEEVNALIGQPADTPLDPCKTKWQIVIEKLGNDLVAIPVASGPWWEYGPDGRDPAMATYGIANFEVVENATDPAE